MERELEDTSMEEIEEASYAHYESEQRETDAFEGGRLNRYNGSSRYGSHT